MADLPDGTPERYSCANCGAEVDMQASGHWDSKSGKWLCIRNPKFPPLASQPKAPPPVDEAPPVTEWGEVSSDLLERTQQLLNGSRQAVGYDGEKTEIETADLEALITAVRQARDHAVRYRNSYAHGRAGGVHGLTDEEFHQIVAAVKAHHPFPWEV